MRKTLTAATVLGVLTCAAMPALAGTYYEARTTVDKGAGSSLVHAWIDDDSARIEFVESDMPMTKEGMYIITRDAGQNFFLVNPKEKTYSEWDLAAMVSLAEGMSGLVSLEFSDPEIELLEEGEGEEVAGHDTRYYKYATSYDFRMKMLGIKRSTFMETVQEMWVTDDFDQAALGAWLRKGGSSSGDSSLDRLIAAEMDKIKGFPLKTVTLSTSISGKKSKKTTTRTTMEVTTIRSESVSAERFEIPEDYEEVDLLTGAAGEEEEGKGNPLRGIFGRKG